MFPKENLGPPDVSKRVGSSERQDRSKATHYSHLWYRSPESGKMEKGSRGKDPHPVPQPPVRALELAGLSSHSSQERNQIQSGVPLGGIS